MNEYKGRLGIIQRVLPRYRTEFFDKLADSCTGGLSVFAGAARPGEAIPLADRLEKAKWTWARNLHFFSGAFYLCWQVGLTEWLKTWNPECLVVEANPRYLSTRTAINWAKSRSVPGIGWGLGAPQLRGPSSELRLMQRRQFVRHFDAMIAYSRRGAQEYMELGVPVDRVFVAPNAVVQRPKDWSLEKSKKRNSSVTLLYVGRLNNRKRVDASIRACAALPPNLQPQLQIVGDGPAGPELKQLAMRIYPRTQFIGKRFGRELDELFNQADLFVLPGSGGLAIQEAMAHGLPVIAAHGEDGSQEDMVKPGNGWLIDPGSVEQLQRVLTDALGNPARLPEMGKNSYELVQTEFNLENMVGSFIDAINKVTS